MLFRSLIIVGHLIIVGATRQNIIYVYRGISYYLWCHFIDEQSKGQNSGIACSRSCGRARWTWNWAWAHFLNSLFFFFWILFFVFLYTAGSYYPFYTYECIHVNTNLPIHHTTTKEYIQMANKHMKRWFTSYAVREMQVKTTRSHYTPIRMVKILTTDNTKCWQGYGATGTLTLCWWECRMAQPLWKTV